MKHKERGNTHMAKEQLIFCGSSETFLDKALTADSNADNGGNAFRIPSLVNADGTLIAAIDRASCGADWGYIELAVRRSEDGGVMVALAHQRLVVVVVQAFHVQRMDGSEPLVGCLWKQRFSRAGGLVHDLCPSTR